MEHNEMIGLIQLPECQTAAQKNGKSSDEELLKDTITIVINSENYRIEIEIGSFPSACRRACSSNRAGLRNT